MIAPTVESSLSANAPTVRRLVTTEGDLVHGPAVDAIKPELTRLTGRVSSLARSAAVIIESGRGGIMSVHYERRFGFLISVRQPGDPTAMRLIDPTLPDEPVYVETTWRTRAFSRRSFVSEPHAWHAVRYFAANGDRCPETDWQPI